MKLFKRGSHIHKCKKPTMNNHRGRTWDFCSVILSDTNTITGHIDTSWSFNFYFQIEGTWYRASTLEYENTSNDYSLTYDISKALLDTIT
jgi:hypothetical protein